MNRNPSQQPKFDVFSFIIGIASGSFLTLLQINHVTLNLKWSVAVYALLTLLPTLSVWMHAVPHYTSIRKIFYTGLTFIFLGALSALGIYSQYAFDHQSVPTQSDPYSASDEKAILFSLSTNSSMTHEQHISILDGILNNRNELEKKQSHEHSILYALPFSVDLLKNERQLSLSQFQNSNYQANIQNERSIQAARIYKQEEADALERKTQAEQLQKKLYVYNLALPIFNEAIIQINKALQDLSQDAGARVRTDFPGNTPSVYESNLEKGDMILNGTNYIRLKSKPEWYFQISTFVSTNRYGDGNDNPVDFYSARLKISIHSTNGDAALTIAPSPSSGIEVLEYSNFANWNGQFLIRVISTGGDTNGLDMAANLPRTEYAHEINRAIHSFLTATESLSPISK